MACCGAMAAGAAQTEMLYLFLFLVAPGAECLLKRGGGFTSAALGCEAAIVLLVFLVFGGEDLFQAHFVDMVMN